MTETVDRPKVEVLIVSYNTIDLLRDAIRSIKAATADAACSVSIAVFDNASHDGSPEMVAREFPDVRLIASARNVWYAQSNNLLAYTSDSDYVLLLNSDTTWPADITARLVRTLESDPAAIGVGPRLVGADGNRQWSNQQFPSLLSETAQSIEDGRWPRWFRAWASRLVDAVTGRAEDRETVETTESLWSTCLLIRTRDVRELGLFDVRFPMYDVDLDYCRRMLELGRTFLYDPGVSIVHLGGGSGGSSQSRHRGRDARGLYYRLNDGIVRSLLWQSLFWLRQAFPRVGR